MGLKPWRPPFSSLLTPTSWRFYSLPKHQHRNQLSKHRNPWRAFHTRTQNRRWATMRSLGPHFIIGMSATLETWLWMESVYFSPQCQLLRVGTGSAQRPPSSVRVIRRVQASSHHAFSFSPQLMLYFFQQKPWMGSFLYFVSCLLYRCMMSSHLRVIRPTCLLADFISKLLVWLEEGIG